MSIEHITKYEVKRNKVGDWFWDEVAANGQVVATSGQSFSSQEAAHRACQNAKARAMAAPIVVVDHGATMTKAIREAAARKALKPHDLSGIFKQHGQAASC